MTDTANSVSILEARIEGYKRQIKELNEILEKKIQDHEQEVSEYKNQIGNLEQTITVSRQTIIRLEQQLETIQKDYEARIERRESEQQVLKNQLNNVQIALETSTKENGQLTKQVAEQNLLIEQLRKDKERLMTENVNTKQRLSDAEARLADALNQADQAKRGEKEARDELRVEKSLRMQAEDKLASATKTYQEKEADLIQKVEYWRSQCKEFDNKLAVALEAATKRQEEEVKDFKLRLEAYYKSLKTETPSPTRAPLQPTKYDGEMIGFLQAQITESQEKYQAALARQNEILVESQGFQAKISQLESTVEGLNYQLSKAKKYEEIILKMQKTIDELRLKLDEQDNVDLEPEVRRYRELLQRLRTSKHGASSSSGTISFPTSPIVIGENGEPKVKKRKYEERIKYKAEIESVEECPVGFSNIDVENNTVTIENSSSEVASLAGMIIVCTSGDLEYRYEFPSSVSMAPNSTLSISTIPNQGADLVWDGAPSVWAVPCKFSLSDSDDQVMSTLLLTMTESDAVMSIDNDDEGQANQSCSFM